MDRSQSDHSKDNHQMSQHQVDLLYLRVLRVLIQTQDPHSESRWRTRDISSGNKGIGLLKFARVCRNKAYKALVECGCMVCLRCRFELGAHEHESLRAFKMMAESPVCLEVLESMQKRRTGKYFGMLPVQESGRVNVPVRALLMRLRLFF